MTNPKRTLDDNDAATKPHRKKTPAIYDFHVTFTAAAALRQAVDIITTF